MTDKMEMPNELYADLLLSSEDPDHPFFAGEFKESEHGKNTANKYHHSRIVEALKAENEELQAKLDKARDALRFIFNASDTNALSLVSGLKNGIRFMGDKLITIRNRARKTLEEM